MSSETDINNGELNKITSQLFILVCVVFCWAFYMNNFYHANPKRPALTTAADEIMMIVGDAANAYPEMSFKSDRKWEKYLNDDSNAASGRRLTGKGFLSGDGITMNCLLRDNGQIIGRYSNSNGVKLDVNGYVDSKTNDIHIKLGHGKYESYLIMSPDGENKSKDEIKYTGSWGKKKKPICVTF